LYERGFRSEDVRQLYRMIDWLMELPSAAQRQFRQEVDDYAEGQRMPFVTDFERRGMARLLRSSLRTKFGEEGLELMPAITELDDAEKYEALNRVILMATTLEKVRQAVAKAAAPPQQRKKRGNGKRGTPKT
jgi:hypothetical protein